jgi:hypothetical protein
MAPTSSKVQHRIRLHVDSLNHAIGLVGSDAKDSMQSAISVQLSPGAIPQSAWGKSGRTSSMRGGSARPLVRDHIIPKSLLSISRTRSLGPFLIRTSEVGFVSHGIRPALGLCYKTHILGNEKRGNLVSDTIHAFGLTLPSRDTGRPICT